MRSFTLVWRFTLRLFMVCARRLFYSRPSKSLRERIRLAQIQRLLVTTKDTADSICQSICALASLEPTWIKTDGQIFCSARCYLGKISRRTLAQAIRKGLCWKRLTINSDCDFDGTVDATSDDNPRSFATMSDVDLLDWCDRYGVSITPYRAPKKAGLISRAFCIIAIVLAVGVAALGWVLSPPLFQVLLLLFLVVGLLAFLVNAPKMFSLQVLYFVDHLRFAIFAAVPMAVGCGTGKLVRRFRNGTDLPALDGSRPQQKNRT